MQTYYPPASAQPPTEIKASLLQRLSGTLHQRPIQLVLIIFLALVVLSVLSLPILVILGGYSYYQVTGTITPGVRVGDTRLDWMRVEEAAIELHRNWNLDRNLLVSDGLHTWHIPADQFGISLDAIQTARNAYNIGRRQPMLAEIRQAASSWINGWQIAPVAAVDLDQVTSALETLDAQASKPPQNASFYWDGQQLTPVPGEMGYAINIEESLQILTNDPGLVLTSGYLRVPLKPLIPQVNDVSTSMAEAQRLLDSKVILQAYDAINNEHISWDVPRKEIGSWLAIEAGQNGPEVTLDPERLASYLDSLSVGLGAGRYLDAERYARPLSEAVTKGQPFWMAVSHTPTSYTVQSGETLLAISWKEGMPYWMILQANPGMDPDALHSGQSITIPSKDELLPLPVIQNKRIVISISQQRLWVYQDGQQLSEHVISTGIDRSPTQPGVFQVQTHQPEAYASVWDLYMPDFLGIYEAWPGFMNGIHGLPMLSSGRRLWAKILGKPASYGCIIMELDEAKSLYNWAENGVVVEIQP